MKIIKLSQRDDREAWLELRRGVITGTKSKGVLPPKRGNQTPAGVYELLAEKVAIAKGDEDERDRGLRCEEEAVRLTAKKFKLNITSNPGMWMSDDGKLGVSPDASEDSETPTFAVEAKCLDTKNHLQALLHDYEARDSDTYNPVNSLRVNSKIDFTAQVVQYFVVNPYLQTVYFTLFDDRIALDNIVHYVIVINREDIDSLAKEQELHERAVVNQVKVMIRLLKGIK